MSASITVRLNTLLLVILICMAGAIIAILGARASAGPLDPPAPPASTDGVRQPGTPISSIPFTISQSGSYYLTRNLTDTGGNDGIIGKPHIPTAIYGFVAPIPSYNILRHVCMLVPNFHNHE